MEILKEFAAIAKVLRQADKADELEKIIELQDKTMELFRENERLRKENDELKDYNEIKIKLLFKHNMYWLKNNEDEEGPFCSNCFDQTHILLRMHSVDDKHYKCPACHTLIRG